MKKTRFFATLTLALMLIAAAAMPALAEIAEVPKSEYIDEYYDDRAGSIVYTGDWTYAGIQGTCFGSQTYSDVAAAKASFTFTGCAVAYIATKDFNLGIAEVYIDGDLQGTFDLYSAETLRQQTIFAADGLDYGEHCIEVVVTGDSNPAAAAAFVEIDAFSVTKKFDGMQRSYVNNSDSTIVYSGSWTYDSAPGGGYMNDISYSNTAGDFAEYTFTGTSIAVLAGKDVNRGICEIYLDGVSQGKFDMYSPYTLRQYEFIDVQGLEYGEHSVKIVVTGEKNDLSAGAYVDIDAFAVTSRYSKTVDNFEDDYISYNGSWTHDTTLQISYSNDVNAYAEMEFNGTGITLLATRTSNRGLAEIFIDGVSQGTVDLYSAVTLEHKTVWSSDALEKGNHTIKVAVTGQKNAASVDCYIDIDGFIIDDSTVYAPPEEPAPDLGISIAVSDGAVTEGDAAGKFNITWNANILLETSLEEINSQIVCRGYGVYYGTSEEEIAKLINGEDTSLAKKLSFDEGDDIDVYTIFGMRLKGVPADRSRSAMFYFTYTYEGKAYTVYSDCVSTLAAVK